MTDNEHAIVESLMAEGMGYKKIAKLTGLPLNSVKSYCRRHSAVKPAVEAADGYCRTCGKPVTFVEHRKPKIYCSDACRMKWWNSHKDEVNRKAWYDFTCAHCGRPFQAYGHNERKYCSRVCAAEARRKGVVSDGE